MDRPQEIRDKALAAAVRVSVPGASDASVLERAHAYAHYIYGWPCRGADGCDYRPSLAVTDGVPLDK